MKELVVISGKGGTGKTSIVASLAALARNAVLADCDVDAADLHLVLRPKLHFREDFRAGYRAEIKPTLCSACGICLDVCRFEALKLRDSAGSVNDSVYEVDAIACEGCGVCAYVCPEKAIEMKTPLCGEWYISDTRYGPLIHARLGIAEENSGKLVTLVRDQARKIAEGCDTDLIIVDGPPGIGCPVISSLAGADLVLAVTEPTSAGQHDLTRLGELTRHFNIPTVVCINKWDINPDITREIETSARAQNMKIIGRIRYDNIVTRAQIEGVSVVELSENSIASDLKDLWTRLQVEAGIPNL